MVASYTCFMHACALHIIEFLTAAKDNIIIAVLMKITAQSQ